VRGRAGADRNSVGMGAPFMRSYAELLVKTCHRREAHAIGGMAAFIPSRRDAEVNAVALAKVREDKEREAGQGYDGTWVAHPDLVPVAMEIFDRVLGDRPNQLDVLREDVDVKAADLLNVAATPGDITEDGLRNDISVGIQYLAAWLQGSGAVAIFNLMEDAATSEISRSQVWQWLHHGKVTHADVARITDEEVAKLGDGYDEARQLFEQVAATSSSSSLPCPRTRTWPDGAAGSAARHRAAFAVRSLPCAAPHGRTGARDGRHPRLPSRIGGTGPAHGGGARESTHGRSGVLNPRRFWGSKP
jgi:malate synthase A